MRKLLFYSTGMLGCAMLVLSCAPAPTSATPFTPTHAATTTVTAEPATPDATFSTDPALPPAIAATFEKTRAVTRIRYDINSRVTLTRAGLSVDQPGMHAQGEEDGPNRHLAISCVMATSGQPATFEFITVDGATYTKGLSGIPGIDSTQWYRFGKELGNVTRDAPTLHSLLDDLETNDLKRGAFQKTGQETMDGEDCTLWVAQNPQLAQGFVGSANNSQAAAELAELDRSEFKLWTCSDGYIHQITALVAGHNPAHRNDKGEVQLTIHLFDHNKPVTISAPPDARDFQAPAQGPTPTGPP